MGRLLIFASYCLIIINICLSEYEGSHKKKYLQNQEREVKRGIDGGISCAACSVLLVFRNNY